MSSAQASPVATGDVLAGKYRVDRVLGVGGMGVVVAATHLTLEQHVALKFMLPEVLGNADAVNRFLREARNAVRLKSEHVARILDVGTLDNGAPYIVMEYLDGVDLAGYLQQQGSLDASTAADFILQACEAVAEAHSLGIVHRDLKPPNLFLTRGRDGNPLVKVLDFGIAKAATGDLQLTRTQAVMGSPGYMSPEQMRSTKAADARSDIWAIGVILYQLVSGNVPFNAETFTELVVQVTMDPVPPMIARGALPAGFEAIVRKCLEKDPAQRYQNIAELGCALAPFAPPRSGVLVDKIIGILGAPTTAGNAFAKTTFGASAGQVGVPTGVTGGRSRGWLFGGIAAGVIAIGVTVAVVAAGASSGGANAVTATPADPTPRAPTPIDKPPTMTAVTPPVPSPPPPTPPPPPPPAGSATAAPDKPVPAAIPTAIPATAKPRPPIVKPKAPVVPPDAGSTGAKPRDPLESPD